MFESGHPHKGLLACLCIEVRAICFCFCRIVFGVAFFRGVVTKMKTSIIFTTFNHSLSNGDGNGRGCWATFILSKLHILSYAKVTLGTLEVVFTKEHNHCTSMKNTCDGDSDL